MSPSSRVVECQKIFMDKTLKSYLNVKIFIFLRSVTFSQQTKASRRRQAEINLSGNHIATNCISLEIETMGWPATKLHCVAFPFLAFAPEQTMGASSSLHCVLHCVLIAQRGHYTTHHTSTRRHCKILCVNCKLLKTAPLWATRGTLHIVLYRAHVAQAQNYKTILYFISSTGQIMTWNHWRLLGILHVSITLYVQLKC